MRLKMRVSIRKLAKNWLFWLLIITGVAIILRSLPAWTNAAWGCDFGIYYGLTNSFVESGELFNTYSGWGGSYQYFPVLYAITGFAHWITGLDVIVIMPKIIPIFGGLSVLVFYFFVNELLGDKKIALLSSLFLAVMPFHAYQTSHASPLTIGHFFMLLSLYLFIKYRKDTRYIIPLFISTSLLIMSHHLTTYFYFISIIFIVFLENASKKEWTLSVKKDVVYILLVSGLIFSYWAIVAKPVYESYMGFGMKIGSLQIQSNYLIILFYMAFFSSFGLIWLKRRFNLFIKKEKPTAKSCIIKFFLTVAICLIAMGIFAFIKMPWTNFSFTPLSIIYSLPLILILGFSVAGLRYMRFIQNGTFIKGWLFAILISFVFGLVTNNGAILPHRHIEYIMAPISILAIYGLKGTFSNVQYEETISKLSEVVSHVSKPSLNLSKKTKVIQKRQLFYMAVVIVLVTANAISIYPSHVSLNASYEAITEGDLSAIEWIGENLDRNTTVIASDHRLARITEALGFNTTLDKASSIWEVENLTDYYDELNGKCRNYTRITHILIDDIMRDRVVHVGFGDIVYMTNESYDKFLNQPYERIYRNATFNEELVEEHWEEIYAVNWTYIDEFFKET